jgi:nitroreductase
MDLIAGIDSRNSALRLAAPGPTREHIERIIRAGIRAPDHGRLRPWRFVVLEAQGREKLGKAMADILLAKLPQATPQQLEAERHKTNRAPTIIAVCAKITRGKIPEVEQVGAAHAAAENMFLAAHALGYGVMWKTGAAAYDTGVKAMFDLAPEDHIVAFLYVGTIVTPGRVVPLPIDGIVNWLG